ncbi:MAG: L,D-transpeptidase family protein [Ferruginibacter sp.]
MALIKFLCFFLVTGTIINSCKTKSKKVLAIPMEAATIQGNFSPQTLKVFDSTVLVKFLDSFPRLAEIKNELYSFYNGRNYAYAWFDENGMIEQAGNLFNRVKNISEEGLDTSSLVYQEDFNELMENHSESIDDAEIIFTELMLSSQYLLYAKNVWHGLNEQKSLELQWLLPRKKISYVATLDSLLSGKDLLENPPVYRQYYLLKEYLKKYKLAEAADTVLIIPVSSTYKKGDSSEVISKVRDKLFQLGDLDHNSGVYMFDESLKVAVKTFQQRLGLNPTGIIKKAEIEELNVPLHKRIEQILVNMERSRWVPQDVSNNYILVNIPEFKLHVVENDSLLWSINVVVGKNQHKTVVFNGEIKYVVFSPYWNIPSSIMGNEILPALRRNPNYLKTHNMEWNGNTIRQKPGPNNALGLVKFLFPNSHSIYLHDSPAKSLFGETSRAFSHGCIRVEEPKKLAMYLLRNDGAWTEEKISAAMNAEKERYVTLNQPLPVFIAYFTSWVDRAGKLNFRKDIYQRDDRLLQMIIN